MKISTAVEKIIQEDHLAQEALKKDILNLSSYARSIKPQIEDITKKPVQNKSIVVALSRIAKKLPPLPQEPPLRLFSITIHGDLGTVTCSRTEKNIKQIQRIYKKLPEKLQTYFSITTGTNEITLIAERHLLKIMAQSLQDKVESFLEPGLRGLTVKFPIEYLNRPNVLFALTKKLAVKNINLIEVVSTASEFTFLIKTEDIDTAVKQLNAFLE